MKKVPVRRAILAAVAIVTVTTGCFGSFPLTRKLYNVNNSFSNDKWVKELFFLATAALIPLYGVATLIDVVILNSQEFWSGKSSMNSAQATEVKVINKGNVTITQTMTQAPEGRTMVLEEMVDGRFHSRTTLRQATGASIVYAETVFADGRKENRSLTADEAGALTIAEANGTHRVLSHTELPAIGAN